MAKKLSTLPPISISAAIGPIMIRIARINSSIALWATAILVATGCEQAPPVGQVQGTVTLDGKPVDNGTIRFTPLEGQAATAGGVIDDGKFSSTVPIAKHRVEISATQISGEATAEGRHTPVAGDYTATELIPEKYNTNSELTLDVTSGLNEPHFDLKSR
jgi:hypothetical protein